MKIIYINNKAHLKTPWISCPEAIVTAISGREPGAI